MNEKIARTDALALQQVGSGPDLVLLHSLLTDASAFRHILPALQRRFRVTLPSLPGYGASPRMSNGGVPEVARAVAATLASAGISRFDLIGNGYGGFVALSLAQQFGDRVERLVLLDTAAGFPPVGKEGIAAMKKGVEARGMAGVADAAMQRLFPDGFAAANAKLIDGYRKALLGFDPVAFAAACQSLIDVDLRAGLAALKPKTLVVVGLEDAATPPALSRELAAAIPGSRLIELPACGHVPHIQAPARVLEILDEFLPTSAGGVKAV